MVVVVFKTLEVLHNLLYIYIYMFLSRRHDLKDLAKVLVPISPNAICLLSSGRFPKTHVSGLKMPTRLIMFPSTPHVCICLI